MTLHNVSYRHYTEKRVLASGASSSLMITEIGELSSIWRAVGLFRRSFDNTPSLESSGCAEAIVRCGDACSL